MMMPMSTVFS